MVKTNDEAEVTVNVKDTLKNLKGPRRLEGEAFKDYKTRITFEKRFLKQYLKGRPVWAGHYTYIKSVHGALPE